MIYYWINLDKDTDRKAYIECLFRENNYQNVRIQAVENANKELGCTLSHLKAIRQFIKSSDAWAIICEDDLSLEFKQYWTADIESVIQNAPVDWDIIQLAITVHDDTINKFYKSTSNYLPHSAGYHSTVCYAINRTGAEKIASAVSDGIADVALYTNAKTYTYRRPLFTYADFGSNIHPEHLEGHAKSKLIVEKWLMSSK